MRTVKELNEERVAKEERFSALVEQAKSKTLSNTEKDELNNLEKEMNELDKEIEQAVAIEKRSKTIAERNFAAGKGLAGGTGSSAPDAEVKELNKIAKRYSFAKTIQNISSKRDPNAIEGLEKEMFEEAQNEAKAAGISLTGNIAIPSKFIQIGKQKLLDVATEVTDAVYTEYGGLIPILRPNPIVSQMGGTFLTGLQGNVQWTRHNGDVALAFETENSDVNETTPTLDNISISPKRFGGYLDVSNQFLVQAPWVVEPWLRGQLEARYALTLDTQALVGTGTGNAPTGITSYNGVNIISLGTAGGDMTYGAILEFIRATKTANARMGSSGFLTNAYGEFALARTPLQSGGAEGNFVYKMDGRLVGRNFMTTELIPSTFVETDTDLVAMIYSSRWESLIVGTWGGMDILFDPYTQALGGKKRFVLNAYMDVEIEQPLEFAVCKDWNATDAPAIT